MDFSFTEEQTLLADSVRRYLDDRFHFEARKQWLKTAEGAATHSPTVWSELAGLGVLALLVPEQEGGLGGGAVETLVVAQALGSNLVLEPFLGSAVVATRALALLGSEEQRAQWLPAMAEGKAILVPVLGGTAASTDAALTATASADGWQLNGTATAVYHAPFAQAFVVAARIGAGEGSGEGPADALFLVPADSAGLKQTAYVTVDSQGAADLMFAGVHVNAEARLGAGDTAAAIAALADLALFTLCAEALGSMDQAVALTVDYTRNRHQFGVPLARFQVLQHRMVDMQTQVEQARSLVYLAASLLDGDESREQAPSHKNQHCGSELARDRREQAPSRKDQNCGSELARDSISRTQAVAAMQVLVLEAARYVSQQAVQLHGGMGVTDEMAISHHFKRLLATGLRCGTAAQHLDRYAS